MGESGHLTLVKPVTMEWKTMPWTKDPDMLDVPVDLYCVGEKTVEEKP
jgi:hypothetical protein